jgi:hypothetical protein
MSGARKILCYRCSRGNRQRDWRRRRLWRGIVHGRKCFDDFDPEPFVLILNTVPLPPAPPYCAVPYKVSPDNIKPASGQWPSLLV